MLRFVPSETYSIAHPGDPEVVVDFRPMDTLERLAFDEEHKALSPNQIALKFAERQIKGWRGIGGKDGNPLPLTPENAVDALYSDNLLVTLMTDPPATLRENGARPTPYKVKFYLYLIEEAKKRSIEAGKDSGPQPSA